MFNVSKNKIHILIEYQRLQRTDFNHSRHSRPAFVSHPSFAARRARAFPRALPHLSLLDRAHVVLMQAPGARVLPVSRRLRKAW